MSPITVQELIDKLSKLENKNLPVFIYALNTLHESKIHWIDFIDVSSDRVDINGIHLENIE